mmetsp:Transcript_35695/g.93295  ORF Transcript_35695/g.93295 Transcript_35695/m.93295 type:complete len:219 (-) Transcript_35695:86-742(-)
MSALPPGNRPSARQYRSMRASPPGANARRSASVEIHGLAAGGRYRAVQSGRLPPPALPPSYAKRIFSTERPRTSSGESAPWTHCHTSSAAMPRSSALRTHDVTVAAAPADMGGFSGSSRMVQVVPAVTVSTRDPQSFSTGGASGFVGPQTYPAFLRTSIQDTIGKSGLAPGNLSDMVAPAGTFLAFVVVYPPPACWSAVTNRMLRSHPSTSASVSLTT